MTKIGQRKFRTRNGSILQETPDRVGCNERGGFVDDYKVIESADEKYIESGHEWICLSLTEGGFPVGGSHGPKWDIVEEVPD
jgi:hypothetical protein